MYGASGVSWVAAVTPYYIRVNEKALANHFRSIADAASVPVIVYDIPGNTANPLTDAVYDAGYPTRT